MLLDGNQTYYTRTGSFAVNEDGFIVLAGTDFRLAVLDEAGRPVSLNIDDARTSPPEETTSFKFADNLSNTANTHTIADVKVYDERGGDHLWKLEFTRPETVFDEWTVKVTDGEGDVDLQDVREFGDERFVDMRAAAPRHGEGRSLQRLLVARGGRGNSVSRLAGGWSGPRGDIAFVVAGVACLHDSADAPDGRSAPMNLTQPRV